MAFCSFSSEYAKHTTTTLDNAFIYDFMPKADGEAVKVYLYGLYLSSSNIANFSAEEFAKRLEIPLENVIKAFEFWQSAGLCDVVNYSPLEVKFLPITTTATKLKKISGGKYQSFSQSIQRILPDRMISVNEYNEYFDLMETFNIKPDAMLLIVQYCVNLKGNDISYRYIASVARDFAKRGIITTEGIEEALSSYVAKSGDIKQILTAMNSKKQPDIEDLAYFNKWTKDFGFELLNLIVAAKKFKKNTFAKLDGVICELYSFKKFSKKEIEEYHKKKEEIIELAVKINKKLGVYYESLDNEIETYVLPWLSKGYDEQSLILIANYCFRTSVKSLPAMDDKINQFFKNGLVSFESLIEHFERLKTTDDFIISLLSTLEIDRKPNNYDRELIKTWRRDWNFSNELISYASTLAKGKQAPIPYLHSILSTWKNKGIFSVEEAKKHNLGDSVTSTSPSSALSYAQRDYSEKELDKLIDDIGDITF